MTATIDAVASAGGDAGGDALGVLARIESELDTLAALDSSAWSGSVAIEVAARIAAAQSRLGGVRLAALRVVKDSGAWALDGSRSMPAALARGEDTSFGAVRAEMTLSDRLTRDLPLTGAALRAGDLSGEKAKLLARLVPTSKPRRAALADPERGEAFLLAQAKTLDVADLTRLVQAWRYRVDPDADDRDYREASGRYFLQIADTVDGADIRGFVCPESAVLVRTALDAITGTPAQDDPRTSAQRNADALTAMARYLLDTGEHAKGVKVRPHLNVTVGYDTLLAAAKEAGVDPATFTETGMSIPRTVLDRISCDAEVTRIIFGPDSVILDAGRTKRIVTDEQRRAVITRDRDCRMPGCHAPPRFCEVHHRIWWTRGGHTCVKDSVLLCYHHHDQIHRDDITITRHNGQWIFHRRDGTQIH